MDAWEMFAMVLFLFPPTAILFIACVIKLFAVLEETTISWGKSFGIATIFNIVAFVGYGLYLDFYGK